MTDLIKTNGKWTFHPEEWKFVRRISRDEMADIVGAEESLRFAKTDSGRPMYLWPNGHSIDAGSGDYLNLKGEYFHVELREKSKHGWVKLHQLNNDPLSPSAQTYQPQPIADVITDTHSRICTECGWISDHAPGCSNSFSPFGRYDSHTEITEDDAEILRRTKTQEIPVIDLKNLRPEKREVDLVPGPNVYENIADEEISHARRLPDGNIEADKTRKLAKLTRSVVMKDPLDQWSED